MKQTPNPSDDIFNISFISQEIQSLKIRVLNIVGEVIYSSYDLSDNIFLQDGNYNASHTVLKNETLSDIMLKYYGSKSFNKNIYFNYYTLINMLKRTQS